MTTSPPADEGYYWFSSDDQSDPFIVYVDLDGNVKGVDPDLVVWRFSIEDGGLWSEREIQENF